MYAIYLNDLERFIAIEQDLWIAHASAKLLSSKLSICICDIGNESSITNYNCWQWTLSTPDLPASTQYPKLVVPKDSKLEFVGDPINTDMEMLKLHQQFCLLVLKIVLAAKMTDAELNAGDRKYFQLLLEIDSLSTTPDDSGIPGGFLHNIEKILYLNSSTTDIMANIELMFNNSESIFPRNLAQYKSLFYKYLNV
jgi:hypothetical protein